VVKFTKLGRRLIFAPRIQMNFYDYPRVVDFRKFVEGSNTFEKGQRISGHFLDGFGVAYELVVLEDTQVIRLRMIPVDVRNEWGQPARPITSAEEMFDNMKRFYPDITPQAEISINFLRFALSPQGDLIEHEFPEDLRPQTELLKQGTSDA
jgi:hypothetical protein